MKNEQTEQFEHLQETLGTLLLALNWPSWTEEDRTALLGCVDCLERKHIDMKHGSNIRNSATSIERPR